MVWGRRQMNISNRNNNKQQQRKWLLCFSSLFDNANAITSSKKERESNGQLFYRRNSLQYYLRRHRRFLPTMFVFLVLLLLFAYFSPPVFDQLQLQHRRRLSLVDKLITTVDLKNGATSLSRDLWSTGSSEFYYGCSNASKEFLTADAKTHPDRYLLISTSGGLNQQRTGITDAVVAAYILNATLIVPMLDQKSYWKDASDFGEIFNVDWFISFLSKDVKILKALPTVGGKVFSPVRTRVPRKCSPKYYVDRILPLLNKKHAVELTKFDYRLSNNLDMDLQKLRCRVNYHALRFTDPIVEMGRKLVERMRMKSKHFIALHLRFEPDMLAFSGCDYGGGEKEKNELGAIRRRWKTLHKSNPEKQRRQGKCPLTPEEVGLMLRALGFNSEAHIYVASGEVYGGEETLAPLRALFPNFRSKDSIATQEELAPFSSYSARMAALDFIVCDASDVFVSNNNGNMARILAGRRRYYGHKPSIRPNAKKLSQLLMNRTNMSWEEFGSGVRSSQVGFTGEANEAKQGKEGSFHENPSSCICKKATARGDYLTSDHVQAKDYQSNLEDEQDLIVTSESDQPEIEYLVSDLMD